MALILALISLILLRIALTAAFDMAFARQEQDIVVVEYLHVSGSDSV